MEIKINCIETLRKNTPSWADSGKEYFIIRYQGSKVCLELIQKKRFRVNKEGEEIPISDHRRHETFVKVESVFINDTIPVYRQVI